MCKSVTNQAEYFVSEFYYFIVILSLHINGILQCRENKLPQDITLVLGGKYESQNRGFGISLCALRCDLRGQNEGQILKIREILYIISFYQLSTPPSGIP